MIDDGDRTSEKWYAARTRHGQELKIKEKLESLHIRHFIPVTKVLKEAGGRKYKAESPLISNLVFLKCTQQEALSIANGRGIPVYYIIDHSTRRMLVVPDKQMEDFIRVVTENPDSICTDAQELPVGAAVRIVGGGLDGVEGKVVLLPNRTYVLVSVGQLLCARVQIPRANVRRI